MGADEFTKLFNYIVERFDKVDRALETKADAKDLHRVMELLDKLLKENEINREERLILGHQLDRLDRWVHELASKIGYTLTA